MNVCFLAPELYPIWGGGGAYALGLLQNIPKDVEVHVLVMKRNVPEFSEEFLYSTVRDYFNDNIHLHFISRGRDTFFSHFKFQYQCYPWVLKLHKKYSFDVIHGQHQPMSDIFLKFSSKNLPYITTVHETFSRRNSAIKKSKVPFSQLEFSEKWMSLFSPFLKLTEKLYMKKSSKLISPSRWMKNVLHDDFNFPMNNIYVVNNGVDHKKFHPKIKISEFIQKIKDEANGPIVLFSGRMISTKGVHILIKAIPEILNEIKDAYFIFVGGGFSKPYRELLKKYNIPIKNYNFLGYIPNFDDIPGLYSIASIFTAPTLYENFPIRILENMSSQNPVVATNIVGIPEIIKNGLNGLLIPPYDYIALAENIIKLLDDKNLYNMIAHNARKTIEKKFTLKIFTNKTLEVYKKLSHNY